MVLDARKMVEAAVEQSKAGENVSFSVLFSCSFNKMLKLWKIIFWKKAELIV